MKTYQVVAKKDSEEINHVLVRDLTKHELETGSITTLKDIDFDKSSFNKDSVAILLDVVNRKAKCLSASERLKYE